MIDNSPLSRPLNALTALQKLNQLTISFMCRNCKEKCEVERVLFVVFLNMHKINCKQPRTVR